MNLLLEILFPFLCIFLTCTYTVNADTMSVEDLLDPQLPSMTEKSEERYQIVEKPKNQFDIDESLGPQDIFPFLPDNHRDSGTGKFNSF